MIAILLKYQYVKQWIGTKRDMFQDGKRTTCQQNYRNIQPVHIIKLLPVVTQQVQLSMQNWNTNIMTSPFYRN